MEVLEPTIETKVTAESATLAERPATLDGKTIGVIWNSRPLGDKIIRMTLDNLRAKYKIRDVVWAKPKPFLGNMSPKETLDEIAAKADVAITGVGD